MDIQFSGFKDAAGVRQFAFDLVRADRSRTRMVVTADLSLARKYDIRPQELPLLCRRLIEEPLADLGEGRICLTEQHMVAIRTAAQDVVEKKRRRPAPVTPNTGRAWRQP